MTASKYLLNRLDAVMDDLTAAMLAHNRLAVVGEVAASVDQVGRVALNAMCAEARVELDTTICLVTLLTGTHQDFIGAAGPLSQSAVANGTDVSDSLCQYVVATGSSLQVDDTSTFCSTTPGLAGMNAAAMHSYYGEPIDVRGQTIGSFCALDAEVRHWEGSDRAIVRRWAGRVADHLGGLVAP
ncbi:MAG: GAF domain-containing protein [Actinomycetota bacterium]|nr:GAF domain-containing protein [Actinomycetota bacterium]